LGRVGIDRHIPVILSTHPRTRERLSGDDARYIPNNNVLLHDPFGMFDYIKLQLGALCCLSDSGTIHEDATILGITAVNVRNSQERPETYDTGNVLMSGTDEYDVIDTVRMAIEQATERHTTGRPFSCPPEYTVLDYSDRAVRVMHSVMKSRISG
jgi:UDP-N-acetylglucosamine 2-epimerase (non-hydrolysing)